LSSDLKALSKDELVGLLSNGSQRLGRFASAYALLRRRTLLYVRRMLVSRV
jgi:hypothetical protein